MQVEKAYIREKILQVARTLFFQKGYNAVTMRQIAHYSGIGLGSIYTYFKSKEVLLKEILSPFLANMQAKMEEHFEVDQSLYDPAYFTSQEGLEQSLKMVLDVVEDYREELLFLFTYGHQTLYRHYFTELTHYYYQKSCSFMQSVSQVDPSLFTSFSKGLLFLLNEMWIAVIRIFVCNKEMDEQERYQFLSEYVAFCTAGWNTLLRGDDKAKPYPIYESYTKA